ncbi:unnamed protein product [Paramecium octaurelia]|uniref:Uncharacterized protein n=1 Tax=Paramecium octaurelia TaxID=43137 RepID=A0A8S1V1Q8_PAROT|nr:unnamed protein product [Paramecium octaurelia]
MVANTKDNYLMIKERVWNILYYYNNGEIFIGQWFDDNFNGSALILLQMVLELKISRGKIFWSIVQLFQTQTQKILLFD